MEAAHALFASQPVPTTMQHLHTQSCDAAVRFCFTSACTRGNSMRSTCEPGVEGDKFQVLPPGVSSSHMHRKQGWSPLAMALTVSHPLCPTRAVVAKKIAEKMMAGK